MPYLNTDNSFLDVSGLWALDGYGASHGGKYFKPNTFPQTTKALTKFKKDYTAAKEEYETALEQLKDAELIDMEPAEAARHRADLETKFVLATANSRQNLIKKAEGEVYRAAFMVLRFLYANGGTKDEQGNETTMAFLYDLAPIMDSIRGTDTDKVIKGLFDLLAIAANAGAPVNADAVEQTYRAMDTDGRRAIENLELYFTGHDLLKGEPNEYDDN